MKSPRPLVRIVLEIGQLALLETKAGTLTVSYTPLSGTWVMLVTEPVTLVEVAPQAKLTESGSLTVLMVEEP